MASCLQTPAPVQPAVESPWKTSGGHGAHPSVHRFSCSQCFSCAQQSDASEGRWHDAAAHHGCLRRFPDRRSTARATARSGRSPRSSSSRSMPRPRLGAGVHQHPFSKHPRNVQRRNTGLTHGTTTGTKPSTERGPAAWASAMVSKNRPWIDRVLRLSMASAAVDMASPNHPCFSLHHGHSCDSCHHL